MSQYIGAYNVPKDKVDRWQELRRQAKLLESPSALDVRFSRADAIQAEYDLIPEAVYKFAQADLKKAGFDVRRGDQMIYGFDYLKDDEVLVWMEKGDDVVPDQKAGFGAKS